MEKFNELKELLEEATNDAKKTFEKKNVAASVRLRSAMQNIKSLAQEVREEALNMRAEK